MSGTGERLYRALLRAYPASFRARFGVEMVQLYRDRQLDETPSQLWGALAWDLVRSAPLLRLEQLRERMREGRGGDSRRPIERGFTYDGGIMTVMALLTVLVGIFEIANSSMELRYGVSSDATTSLLAGIVGVFVGVLLVAAGFVILRRSPTMIPRVRFAAIVSLLAFLAIQFTMPVFSIFATALGVLFPIALLVWLRVRGDGAGAARAV